MGTFNTEMSRAVPRLYLGTMTFGWNQASVPVTEEIATEMSLRARAAGISLLDSARIYSGGATEPIVGAVLRNLGPDKSMGVTTKAHPTQPGALSAEGVSTQLQAALSDMGVQKVEEFYLHQPDTEHELSATLAAVHEMCQQGLIGKLGMSNYHAVEVERTMALCAENGWTPPSVYQGLYNPLNRIVEAELLPVLQKHNISFVAYNALAAGLLTGKHSKDGEVTAGRFKDNANYLPRFYTDANFQAVETIQAALPEGMELIGATYQWLLRHSALSAHDGVLLGASSLPQLDSNLAACAAAVESEDLPAATLAAFDQAWEITKAAGSFPYWRGYSKDHPNREELDQGASYNAAKKK